MPDDRVRDVSAMADSELERARRDLMVSLSLAFPGSPVREPILTHISAIYAELANGLFSFPRVRDIAASIGNQEFGAVAEIADSPFLYPRDSSRPEA